MKAKFLTLPLAVLMMPALGGCFKSANLGSPSADAPAFKNPPRECERIAKPVADPGGKDGKPLVGLSWEKIAGRYRGAFVAANKRIDKVGGCEAKQADALNRSAK